MTSDLWTHLITHWPHAAAGVTQRGPHDPAVPWSGYNLGHTASADHAAVDALRHRALQELSFLGPPASSRQPWPSSRRMICAQQIHSNRVALARHADLASLPQCHGRPYYHDCDAIVTGEPGLALTLFYADCCPIILYSLDPRCGGVAHAGWRGTVADMAGAVVSALQREFGAQPAQLRALVGPCIGVECYEVGPEVMAAVEALGIERCVRAVTDRDHLDLLSLNVALLQRAGVLAAHIQTLPHCTRCGPVPLFSWRRDGPDCGRHVAMFMLS